MPVPQWLLTLSGWVYAAIVLACLIAALFQKREAAQALGWSLAIVFLPVMGPILFLTFGLTRVSRRLRRKIEHHESFEDEVAVARADGNAATSGVADRWCTLSRVMEDLGQGPRRAGNRVELFTDGAEAYAEMELAIRAAEHHIHVQFYIFRNDEVGRNAIDVLCERARAGVEVRLILDGVGSMFGIGMARRLRKAGGQVAAFLPLFFKLVSPNLRNHRKTVICDGKVAFFGGLNVGEEHLGRRRDHGRDWADFHMRLDGPSVQDLQWIFLEDWDFCTGETISGDAYLPLLEPAGDRGVQIIAGGPDLRPNPVRQAFLGAFMRAQKSILIVTPYLVPDIALNHALQMAARSGVRTRILTQFPPPDRWMPYFCSMSYAEELSEAGIEIYGYQPGFVHAKAIVVDSEWAMLGTANLDNRSMFLNFEQMALFDGAEPARIEAAIEALIRQSVPLDGAFVAARPVYQRLLMRVARLFAPLF